jgi:hypothetical protein
MKKHLLALLFLQLPALASASAPSAKPAAVKSTGTVAVVSDAERYARRCQTQSPHRIGRPQGTMLWGTKRSWDTEKTAEERGSVLVSADLAPLRKAEAGVKALRLEGGHLVAALDPKAGASTSGVVGTVLQGTASDGKPVEVAICGAEPSAQDPGMIFYRIEAWNSVAQEWENPCVALGDVPDPRALAVGGVWDTSGAHHATPGKLTFACENGVITKCVLFGYKPWAHHDGKPVASLHQACTRLARADYCGNGRSHTRDNTPVDIYDRLGLLQRASEASAVWDPAKASFEAAWGPDGATCLARTRDGRAVDTILQECPGRFQAGEPVDLGDGERCTVRRKDVSPSAGLLRNLSYGPPKAAAAADKNL